MKLANGITATPDARADQDADRPPVPRAEPEIEAEAHGEPGKRPIATSSPAPVAA